MLDTVDENVPPRNNDKDSSLTDRRSRHEATTNDTTDNDVDYWKRECFRARQCAENARAEADSFLQSSTELEEEMHEHEKEKNELGVQLHAMKKQLCAAEHEISRLKTELDRLVDEKRKADKCAASVDDVAVQVWETELDVTKPSPF